MLRFTLLIYTCNSINNFQKLDFTVNKTEALFCIYLCDILNLNG